MNLRYGHAMPGLDAAQPDSHPVQMCPANVPVPKLPCDTSS